MFDAQTRKKIKRECKNKVKEQLGRCILIQFLFTIPGVLVAIMLYMSLLGSMLTQYPTGGTGSYLYGVNNAASMNTVWLVILIVFLVIGPLQYGMIRFYIRMHRDEHISVGILLQPFTSLKSFWAGVRMMFCRFCRYIIWLFVPIFALSVGVLFGAFMLTRKGWVTQGEMVRFVLSVYLISQLVLMPFFVKLMSYNAGWLELHDDERSSVWAATRNGAALFRGHYGKLFVFELSFFGWYLLSAAITFLMNMIINYSGVLASPTQEMIVSIVTLLAGGFLQIVISGYLTAYHYTSFWAFCDVLSNEGQLVEQNAFTQQ